MVKNKLLSFVLILLYVSIQVKCDNLSSTLNEDTSNPADDTPYETTNSNEDGLEEYNNSSRPWFELEHEVIDGQQSDQPNSGERFVAIHVDAVGGSENLNPNLIGLASMATTFLPKSFTFTNIITATREIVAGVRYDLLLNAIDQGHDNQPIVCKLAILEQPWITTEWGEKKRTLINSNCSRDGSWDHNEVNIDDDPSTTTPNYRINPIFDTDKKQVNDDMTDERLKNLESIIIPARPDKIVKPMTHSLHSANPNVNESEDKVTQISLSKKSESFLDDFFSSSGNIGPGGVSHGPPQSQNPTPTSDGGLTDETDESKKPIVEEVFVRVIKPTFDDDTMSRVISRFNDDDESNGEGNVSQIATETNSNQIMKENLRETFENFVNYLLNSTSGPERIDLLNQGEVQSEIKRLLSRYGDDKSTNNINEIIDSVITDALHQENSSSQIAPSDLQLKIIDPDTKQETIKPAYEISPEKINRISEIFNEFLSANQTTTTSAPQIEEMQNIATTEKIPVRRLDNLNLEEISIIDGQKLILDDPELTAQFDALMKNLDEALKKEGVDLYRGDVTEKPVTRQNVETVTKKNDKSSEESNETTVSTAKTKLTKSKSDSSEESSENKNVNIKKESSSEESDEKKTQDKHVITRRDITTAKSSEESNESKEVTDSPNANHKKNKNGNKSEDRSSEESSEEKQNKNRKITKRNGKSSEESNKSNEHAAKSVKKSKETDKSSVESSEEKQATRKIAKHGITNSKSSEESNESKEVTDSHDGNKNSQKKKKVNSSRESSEENKNKKENSSSEELNENQTTAKNHPTGNHRVSKRASNNPVANTKHDFLLNLVAKSLYELDRIDPDKHKRVLLDVLIAKELRDSYLFKIRIGNSLCVEGANHIEDCVRSLIIGSTKICTMEVRNHESSPVQVVKSECLPEKPPVVDNGPREKREMEIIGGPVTTTPDEQKEIEELIKLTLTGIDDVESVYEFSKIIKSERQLVAGISYNIVAEFHHHNVVTNEDSTVICKINVWEKAWLKNGRIVNYDCSNEKTYSFTQNPQKIVKRQVGVPGGITPTDPKDQSRIETIVHESLAGVSDGGNTYTFSRVISSSKQVVSGILYRIKAEFDHHNADKNEDSKVICDIKVWEQPWLPANQRDVEYECDNEKKFNFKQDLQHRKKRQVLGGVTPTDPEDQSHIENIVHESLAGVSDGGNTYRFSRVISSSKQVVSGILYKIEAEFDHHNAETNQDSKVICQIKVWEQSWLASRNVEYSCDNEKKFNFKQSIHRRQKRQRVPGGVYSSGPEDQQFMDNIVRDTLTGVSDGGNTYTFSRVISSTKQVVAGMLYRIEAEFDHHNADTNQDGKVICHIKIWEQAWMPSDQLDVEYKCDNEKQFSFKQDLKYGPKQQVRLQKRQVGLPGGVTPTDPENQSQIESLVRESLAGVSDGGNIYTFSRVISSSSQVVSGILYRIKAEFDHHNADKNEDSKVICDIKVWEQPWMPADQRDVEYKCDNEKKFNFKQSIHRRQKRQRVPGGEYPSGPGDHQFMENMVRDTLTGVSDGGNTYTFSRVISSSKQVVAGMLYRIEAEFDHHNADTNQDRKVICHIKILEQAWISRELDVEYKCDNEKQFNFKHDLQRKQKRQVGLPGGVTPTNPEEQFHIESIVHESLAGVSDGGNTYTFSRVISSTKQVVSGIAYRIKAEFDHHNADTNQDSKVICDIKVWEQPWLPANQRDVEYNCDNEKKFNFKQDLQRRKKRQVFGGVNPTDPEDQSHIESLVHESLAGVSDGGNTYTFSRVISSSKQVVAGIVFRIKAEFDHHNADTNQDSKVICDINVYEQPWLAAREVQYSCDNEKKFNFKQSIKQSRRKRHTTNGDEIVEDYQVEEDFDSILAASRDHTLDLFMSDSRYTDEDIFGVYKIMYNKMYPSTLEHNMRYRIFRDNLRKIRDLNEHEMGTATYGITAFADLTTTEYRLRTGLLRRSEEESNRVQNPIAQIPDIKLVREFDWRTKGIISPVKNQGSCGSCWAFSVVGNIEGLQALKSGKLEEYSEQELLDCDSIDHACNGGLPDDAYKAIEQIGGLELESDYPYKARQGKCNIKKDKIHVQLKGAVDLPKKNETAMALWLLQNGPISIGINANAMQFYRGGVSHPWKPLCNQDNLDHGVLIVGFGQHDYPKFKKSLPYWIVKNSWGPSWGEQGYYRVYRGDNTCGVANMATSAVLE